MIKNTCAHESVYGYVYVHMCGVHLRFAFFLGVCIADGHGHASAQWSQPQSHVLSLLHCGRRRRQRQRQRQCRLRARTKSHLQYQVSPSSSVIPVRLIMSVSVFVPARCVACCCSLYLCVWVCATVSDSNPSDFASRPPAPDCGIMALHAQLFHHRRPQSLSHRLSALDLRLLVSEAADRGDQVCVSIAYLLSHDHCRLHSPQKHSHIHM